MIIEQDVASNMRLAMARGGLALGVIIARKKAS